MTGNHGKGDEALICVLVVEDELFIAMDIEAILSAEGFQVLGPAPSVGVALDILDDECPDFAVLDFNLGREKVTPVALRLKALGVPFVLVSASDAAEFSRYSVLDGIDNVGKPIDPKRLVKAVRELHG